MAQPCGALRSLYVSHAHMAARIRALIDYLVGHIRSPEGPKAA